MFRPILRASTAVLLLLLAPICGAAQTTTQFSYTGAEQTWTAPVATTVQFQGRGAGAVNCGSGYVEGAIAVAAGDVLTVAVGGTGAVTSDSSGVRQGGGGMTSLKKNGAYVAVAGGCGGLGGGSLGGNGGGLAGGNGQSNAGEPGGGGTQTAGGTSSGGGPGSNFQGGSITGAPSPAPGGYNGGGTGGANAAWNNGGGGGGYFGGATGGATTAGSNGGGGGSALVPAGGTTATGTGSSAGTATDSVLPATCGNGDAVTGQPGCAAIICAACSAPPPPPPTTNFAPVYYDTARGQLMFNTGAGPTPVPSSTSYWTGGCQTPSGQNSLTFNTGFDPAKYLGYQVQLINVTRNGWTTGGTPPFPGQPTLYVIPTGSTTPDMGAFYDGSAQWLGNPPPTIGALTDYQAQPVGLLLTNDVLESPNVGFGGVAFVWNPEGAAAYVQYQAHVGHTDGGLSIHYTDFSGFYRNSQTIAGLVLGWTIVGGEAYTGGLVCVHGIPRA